MAPPTGRRTWVAWRSRPARKTITSDRSAKGRAVGRKVGGRSGGLGVKKLVEKVDDSLFKQAPAEPQPSKAKEEFASPAGVSSLEISSGRTGKPRFAYEEEEEGKTVARGKDGHSSLTASGDDFFSDPLGKGPRADVVSRKGNPKGASSGKRKVESGEAQARLSNSKSISSGQFFRQNGDDNYERQARLGKFSAASATSSAQYFGRDEGIGPRGANSTAGDLVGRLALRASAEAADLKAVAKEAGKKLLNLASNLMNELGRY